MTPFISLCMIVKNEEKVLKRCLESLKDLVDEMIIVDTGSTDGTKAIAYEYTSHVYDFEWVNDFSAAKNEAIRKAKGKWILVLDADEYVQQEGKEELKRFLSGLDSTQPISFSLPIVNYVGDPSHNKTVESFAARLFPNHPDICYTGPIHEQLTYRYGELQHQRYDFYIFHTGYTDEVRREKDKSSRNLAIFQSLLKKGGKLNPYYEFTLANEYSVNKNNEKALYHYERAYRKSTKNEIWAIHCLVNLINVLFQLNRYREAWKYIEEGISRWGHYADFYCFRGFLLDRFGLYEQAIDALEHGLEVARNREQKNEKFWLVSTEYSSRFPHQKLAEIYFKLHNLPKTVHYLTLVVHENERDFTSLYKLVHLLCQSEPIDAVAKFLNRLLPEEKPSNLSILLQISLFAGKRELADYYIERYRARRLKVAPLPLLRYAIVSNDKPLFDDTLTQLSNPATEEGNRLSLLLAACVWKKTSYLQPVLEEDGDEKNRATAEFLQAALENGNARIDEDTDVSVLVQILLLLFNAGYYDEYDWLVKHAESRHADIANKMGHAFFTHNQMELALDYYGLLLEKGLLDADGYENLAMLYLSQGVSEEGLFFLKEAIERNPQNVSLYVRLLLHHPPHEERQAYRNRFFMQFPQYRHLPFLHTLLS